MPKLAYPLSFESRWSTSSMFGVVFGVDVHIGVPVHQYCLHSGTPEMVTLTVGNFWILISSEKIRMIFDPLIRALPAENSLPPAGNLGLGLFITKEVVTAHGGTIEVTSSESDGTIFTARFPKSGISLLSKDF
jgi:signal transduction histidine kinase